MKAAYIPQPSFRDFLREQLAARCARNPQYSLRAFANYLGVNHSTLSQMLRGKRALSPEAIAKFADKLGLTPRQAADWIDSERHQPAATPSARLLALTRDTAELLDDGLGFAILELLRLPGFQTDSRWIGRLLGATADEVNLTLTRLCRLGFLRMQSPGRWEDCFGDAVLDLSLFESVAVRNLSRAAGVNASTVTLAVPSTHVREALARIARFRSELVAWLDQAPGKDAVYRLDLDFSPVTQTHPQEDR
ncbi:MAG: DUF4423 domain-containing protein [Bryobacterales bacterium]|nr:DUF4423 domain-containing protein [Bryobacterales bacterium]